MQLAQRTLDCPNKQMISCNSPDLSLNLFLECGGEQKGLFHSRVNTRICLLVPDTGAE